MPRKIPWGLIIAGGCAGAVAGFFGAGGGMILVPLLTAIGGLEEEEVFPASLSIILPICLVSLVVTAVSGSLPWKQAFPYLLGSAGGGVLAGVMGRLAISMALTQLVAVVLGFLTGLGIGGGSLLILWLTIALNTAQTTARGINLLFFLPSALIACCFRLKQGTLRLRTVLPAILSGCASAALFSWIGLSIDAAMVKKLFGFLLLLTGLRELMYKSKTKTPYE